MTRDYLTVDDVLGIHAEQIERYGGSDGIREKAGLEAAVARPQSGYYSNINEEAAALWESLSQNHPFIDGNKRTAFSATTRFLALNDVKITASVREKWKFLSERYETGTMTFDRLKTWLDRNTQKKEQAKGQPMELRVQKAKQMAQDIRAQKPKTPGKEKDQGR